MTSEFFSWSKDCAVKNLSLKRGNLVERDFIPKWMTIQSRKKMLASKGKYIHKTEKERSHHNKRLYPRYQEK